MIFTKECVNTIMNINILVAEKGGAQAPWAPLLDPPLGGSIVALRFTTTLVEIHPNEAVFETMNNGASRDIRNFIESGKIIMHF